jgi:hypothetical protein
MGDSSYKEILERVWYEGEFSFLTPEEYTQLQREHLEEGCSAA